MIKPTPEQISAWIESNFDTKPRKGGLELRINNPFDGDTGYHMNISVVKACCHDWRGDDWARGYKPSFLRFVQLYRNCSFAQAVKEVCGQDVTIRSLQNKLRDDAKKAEEKKKSENLGLPKNKKIVESDSRFARIVKNWLKSRGLTEELMELYDIRYAGGDVIWPYYEYDELVYWQSRNYMNKNFLFPPEDVGVTKGMFIYGFDLIEPSDYIIITEAIFDCMTIGAQCCASGGAALTNMQIRKIKALNPVNGVILAPDNDEAGLKSLRDNYFLIEKYFKVYHSIPPKFHGKKDIKDWNDLGRIVGFRKTREIFESSIKKLEISDVAKL